jgi:uncharacterized protein YycO
MIYQLPTGKIIYITVEQFLALSDDELDALSAQNIGEYAKSPWVGSVIKKPVKKEIKEDHEEDDRSIDYTEESDELGGEKPTLSDEVQLEDFPEVPEEENHELD